MPRNDIGCRASYDKILSDRLVLMRINPVPVYCQQHYKKERGRPVANKACKENNQNVIYLLNLVHPTVIFVSVICKLFSKQYKLSAYSLCSKWD